MGDVYGMKTVEGNTLVQRLVAAAIKMVKEQGATYNEACQFVERGLERLAETEDFAEAGMSCVRTTAYWDIQDATKSYA